MTYTAFENIRLLVLDVDGVLTDARVGHTDTGAQILFFSVQDGYGMRALQKAGIPIAVITGQRAQAVTQRMAFLDVKHVFLNVEDKLPVFDALLAQLQLSPEHVAYMGDDLPDLPIMKKVGLAITVPNATPPVKAMAHLCTQRPGGHGAVREVCDLLLQHRKKSTVGTAL